MYSFIKITSKLLLCINQHLSTSYQQKLIFFIQYNRIKTSAFCVLLHQNDIVIATDITNANTTVRTFNLLRSDACRNQGLEQVKQQP